MKQGWKLKQLSNVCEYDKTKHNRGGLPYVGLEHIESHTGKYLGNLEPLEVKSSTFRFSASHLLYGRLRPYLNKVLVPDFEGHCSTEIFPIKLKDELIRKYLYYWLTMESTVTKINNTWTGARMPRANMKEVIKFEVPVPPLKEQKQIVATLDKAFAAIDQAKTNIEKNIQNAQQLFQSKLNQIFSQKVDGWEEKTWNDALEIKSGRNQKQVENIEGEYPIIGSAGKTIGFADEYICEAGTTIIGRKGTINNPMYIESRFWNVDTAFGLHAKEGLHKKFLYFFCLSYDFTQRDKGSGRPSLVKRDLLTMTMPIPSLEIQITIVNECKSLKQKLLGLESFYNNQMNSLIELKKSILQKAFTGELNND